MAFAVALPLLLMLCGGAGGCWPEVSEEDSEERAVLVPAPLLLDGPVARGSMRGAEGVVVGLSPPTSSSGKVMKKRQPKVVPKKAPSTVWNREFGGV